MCTTMVGEKQFCYKNVPEQQTSYVYTIHIQMCNKIMRLSIPSQRLHKEMVTPTVLIQPYFYTFPSDVNITQINTLRFAYRKAKRSGKHCTNDTWPI